MFLLQVSKNYIILLQFIQFSIKFNDEYNSLYENIRLKTFG